MLRVAEQYAGTDTGRQRRANEDSHLARAPLFVVADGMGGAQAGEVASRIAVESFEGGLHGAAEPETALAQLAREANARIHELSHSHAEQAGMGTTLTAFYVGEHEVSIAHVGDSRAYRLRDAELTRLTEDHSLVDELLRQGRLTPEEALEHPQRSVITRALGPEGFVEVDTRSYTAHDGDVYLLCSDGLTTMLAEERLAELLLAYVPASLREAGEALIAAANEAGGRDNITVLLLRVEELDTSAAPATEESPAARVAPGGVSAAGTAQALQRASAGDARDGGRGRRGAGARAPPAPSRPAAQRPAPADSPCRSGGCRARAARRARRGCVCRAAVGVLHRHERARSRDGVPRCAVQAAGEHRAVQQRLRLRSERVDAHCAAPPYAARSLAALGSERGLARAQPRTGRGRMSDGQTATRSRSAR